MAEGYPLNRAGLSPLADLATLVALGLAFRRLRPRMVITFQPKPNVYGIMAAALVGVPRRFAVVEGLGFAFTPGEENLKKRVARAALRFLYRLSFSLAHKVFFLNPDDLNEFVSQGLVQREKAVLLGGIGVPLEEWPPAPPHLEPVTFTLIARLLREKGVREFAEAARRIKGNYPEVRFLLIGPLDTNPGAIRESEVRSWVVVAIAVPWAMGFGPLGLGYLGPLLNPERLSQFREQVYGVGGSSLGLVLDPARPLAFALGWMYSFVTVLLGPFPWQINSLLEAVALGEALVMWLLAIFWLPGVMRLLYRPSFAEIPLFFGLVLAGGVALFSDNIGANTRLRLLIWASLMVYAALRIGGRHAHSLSHHPR